MKRFVLKLFIPLFLMFILVLILLRLLAPQYTHTYNASFIDKMKRLESIKEPKIVLVGNSNLVFGMQSDLLEKEIGMPVVNLGLHGGLGNAFHERMALFNLNRGDVIVICHLSYSDDDCIQDPELALLTVENYFHYWKIFRLKDFSYVQSALPKYIYKCARRRINQSDVEPEKTCYSRSAFNEYGDNVYPRIVAGEENAPYLWHPAVNSICMNRINKFYKYCKKKGATVVIAGYPIISGLPDFSIDEYQNFQEDLKKSAACPVISDFMDYVFDKKYFYAGALHMTNEGARLRTEQLIKDLKAFLKTKKTAFSAS